MARPPSFVGFTTLNVARGSTPETFAIALPSGAAVGDTIILWLVGGTGDYTVDARLTAVDAGWVPSAYIGTASTLADVDVEMTSASVPGVAYVMVVRNAPLTVRAGFPAAGDYFPRFTDELSSDPVAPDSELNAYSEGAVFAVVAAVDSSSLSTPTMGTDPTGEWTSLTELTRTYTVGMTSIDLTMCGYWYDPTNPVPELNPSGTTSRRQGIAFYWQPPAAATTTYLRQRQSPVRAPSRVRPPVTRQRQRPEVT